MTVMTKKGIVDLRSPEEIRARLHEKVEQAQADDSTDSSARA